MFIKEKQRFTQWWIWVLLVLVAVLLAVSKYYTYHLKEPFGNLLPTDTLMETHDLFIFGVILLFATARLVTEADANEIRIRFLPIIFWWKRYRWADMESAEVVKYNAVDEFWGWGIRHNFETWCYNVKGDHGIRIRMKDGEQLLIGTQKAEAFQNLLKELGR